MPFTPTLLIGGWSIPAVTSEIASASSSGRGWRIAVKSNVHHALRGGKGRCVEPRDRARSSNETRWGTPSRSATSTSRAEGSK
jgi:hypothetical protein